MSKFCNKTDSLSLHGIIALEDCIDLPRPNTSNIVYGCNDKILEFIYQDDDLNHPQNCAIVKHFFQNVFFSTNISMHNCFKLFGNHTKSYCGRHILN